MASEHTVTQVLLEWINSFALGKTIRTTEELSDGTIIWEILQDIDPQYFLDEIPERNPSDHWVSKWKNLKHIHKLLVNYIRQQPDGLPSGLDPDPNLELFAQKNSVKDANKLLKLLLIAAIQSPNAQTYVETLQTLSTPTQEGLKNIFEEAQNGELESLDGADEARESHEIRDATTVDPELKFEERMGNLLAENNRLIREKSDMQNKIDEMHARLRILEEHNDSLQTHLATTEDRLLNLKSGKGDPGANAAQNSRYRQQEELIAGYEVKLNAAEEEIDALRKSVESLRAKAEQVRSLQDEVHILRGERDSFSRKANTAEKYRQKLQASQDFEKENNSLKNEINHLKTLLKESDSQQKWTSEREIELDEYKKILPRIEREFNDLQSFKKQLEYDSHAMKERLHNAEEQLERDETLIGDLRERLREYEGSPGSPSLTPGTTTPNLQGNLQRDLEALGIKESQTKSETDDSRKETESVKEQPTQMSTQFDGFSEAFAETLRHTKANSTQGDEYWKLYDQYTATVRKLAEIQDNFEVGKKKLEDALADVSLAGKEKLDLINEVKESCRAEMDTMRTEVREATEKISDLEAELNATHVLAGVACFERDDLRKMLDQQQTELRAEDQEAAEEMKRLLTELTAQESGDALEVSHKSVMDLIKQVAEQIEKNLERLAKRAEYIHQQNEHIKLLQDRISQLEEETNNPQEEDVISKERELELQKQIEALTRELTLMSSSWYELQSKLHNNNNIPISRYRHGPTSLADAQKGWLARQRSAVAGR